MAAPGDTPPWQRWPSADLFKGVVAAVPFVDVMNPMLDASLPLTVGEYLEWGNPNEKAAFDYMRSYSPYDNLKKGAYPAILVTSSFNDSQVMYWEPAKYVAKLRTLKADGNPLLLKMKMEPAGHGGASGRARSPRIPHRHTLPGRAQRPGLPRLH